MNTTSLLHEQPGSAIITVYFIGDNFYINDYEIFAHNMKNIYELELERFGDPETAAGWFKLTYSELMEMYKQMTILLLPGGLLHSTIFRETMCFFWTVKMFTKQLNYANLYDENGAKLWV